MSVANIYYNQPLLGLIDRSFGTAERHGAAALVPTATLGGYALGILLLVPLGDRFPRRHLIAAQLALLSLALAGAALAPSLPLLAAAGALIGVLSTAAQQVPPFAADLAPEESRGRSVGTVMTGLLLGILLARAVSGAVGDWLGWRAVFGAAAVASLLLALLAWRRLPDHAVGQPLGYAALLASLLRLLRAHPALRRAALVQALLFAAFNAFWVTLIALLEGPPHGLGAREAGLYGVLGAAGAFAAPLVGRTADRVGAAWLVAAGTGLVLLSFGVFALAAASLVGLALGVLLLDLGIHGTGVANQSRIYALDPGARGRINTVFITAVFLGGTFGGFSGTRAWAAGGWGAVCLLGAVLALGAAVIALRDAGAARRS